MNIHFTQGVYNLGTGITSSHLSCVCEPKGQKRMKLQQSLTIVAFLGLISICCGHIGGGPISLQNIDPQVYCGRTLARTLASLCFDEGAAEKRSEAGTMYNAILAPYYKEQDIGWPWLAPHKARSLSLPSRGKRYPGIVNECCDKPCSINELLTYC